MIADRRPGPRAWDLKAFRRYGLPQRSSNAEIMRRGVSARREMTTKVRLVMA